MKLSSVYLDVGASLFFRTCDKLSNCQFEDLSVSIDSDLLICGWAGGSGLDDLPEGRRDYPGGNRNEPNAY
jgi:hypothetical protein